MGRKKIKKLTKRDGKYGVYHSLSGLKRLHVLYEKNWDKFKKLDFKSDECRRVENELTALEKSIRQDLGLTGFQCPANVCKDCCDCPGYYWTRNVGYICPLYDHSSNGSKKDLFGSIADALKKPKLSPGCTYDAQGCMDNDTVIPNYQYTKNNR